MSKYKYYKVGNLIYKTDLNDEIIGFIKPSIPHDTFTNSDFIYLYELSRDKIELNEIDKILYNIEE